MEISDRLAVIAGGHLSPPRPTSDWTIEDIGLAMAGKDRRGHEDADDDTLDDTGANPTRISGDGKGQATP